MVEDAPLVAVRERSKGAAYPLAMLAGAWLIAGVALASVTSRVTDWYVMTDELVYERLAISIARTGSPIPRVHGVFVRSLDQLYPLLIAAFFRHGSVAHDIKEVHAFDAFLMTSACIPAFLLARRVTGRSWVAWLLALGSVAIPWLIYSSFLLTETVAYPLSLWAVLAMQRAIVAPSVRADCLVLAILALAFLARTELVVLLAVTIAAVVLFELGAASGSWATRTPAALKAALSKHKVLAAACAIGFLAAAGYAISGGDVLRLSVYGQEIPNQSVPSGYAPAAFGHFAQIAFALGVLPFVVGFAWLLANCRPGRDGVEAHVFACIGASAVVLVVLEVTKYDLGLGGTIVFDRYLFYLAPVVLLAFSCAVLDRAWPRWSLLVPAGLVCLGFALRSQVPFVLSSGQVNPDSPSSILYHPLVELFGSRRATDAALVAGTIALTGLFALAGTRRSLRRRLAPVLIGLVVLLSSVETGYVFVRLFRHDGLSYRPLTAAIPSGLAWVDTSVGPHANVTMIPYHVSSDYLVSERYWRDLEFWNKSVDRDVDYPSGSYEFTGIWFPKITLAFNPQNGLANVSPTRYAVQNVTDVRFGLAGTPRAYDSEGSALIDVDLPWRATYESSGTYDDGWLKPGTPAIVRVFAAPGQKGARVHLVSLQFHAPDGISARRYEVRSNLQHQNGVVSDTHTTFVNAFPVCVPADGHSDVAITAQGASTIPGDLSGYQSSLGTRIGSIDLADLAAQGSGKACTP